MEKVILYGSEYGTAERYARQLARETGIPVFGYEDAPDLKGCGLVIYFGGLYAGGVKGLKQTLKALPMDTKMVLATVGLADVTDPENILNIRASLRRQVPEPFLEKAAVFHLRGGIDYDKLSLVHKTMMAMLYQKARRLPEEKKTAEVRAMIETYNTKVDFVDFGALEPIRSLIDSQK